MGVVILTIAFLAISLAFSIFTFVAVGICGSDCPRKMYERRNLVFGSGEPYCEVWTPLLVISVLGTITSGANTMFSSPKLKNMKLIKIMMMVLALITIGVGIWFLVEHYLFWAPSSQDALSGYSRKMFFVETQIVMKGNVLNRKELTTYI
eukprot:gnl/Chilomastix_caulleri/1772.p1 GENE.gnl/Chilomastix_caulleri/1772~~gnl/Chilomastix_caulleri/1772.p1  ORF type:complete len:169 (-),score=30.83 gnl/Chilomastix_caulleri/1772:415-864(-)